ncbi:flagellar biosynthesis protein FlhF [Natranaerovirga pectinivora]|uniref:Flagellar biosynthesis protein FlhF n=1 Tax=Natranaerovirga pectinivora TaxID=682400 RepID=A0A4R3MLV8_9FIRM|nr:flagellar biosynthesis protein FlhF [Natranaerovirga pectinivora]TCT15084.1 flagellar biosynthesis protein FlhF [Natranaerovirga pectinivora]
MKLKKYQGKNETEAMIKVKEELGKEALIVNIKTIKPKGFYKLFKKPIIEVTAAIDEYVDKNRVEKKQESDILNISEQILANRLGTENNDVKGLEEKINSLHSIFEKQFNQQNSDSELETKPEISEKQVVIKTIYNQLIDNEVDEIIVNEIINEIEHFQGDDLDDILLLAYQKIIKLLDMPKVIEKSLNEDWAKKVFFIGPTGVGKTTTIAKIASHYVLNENKKVGLITADTYRIAAVEQLRTYANILCVPIKVIYAAEELEEAIDEFSDKDIILIDTAGRSHKNEMQFEEINKLIQTVEEKEVFLVLSATTKYKDLIKITETYSLVSNYKLIFTKLDETTCYGNILNIKKRTGANLSYATFGQNVPDDIGEIDVQEIAKHLLGGNE